MDQTTKPTFSTWQVHLIREALASYRIFTPDHETGKSPLSWNALRERIAVEMNTDFGKDDLRQFVEGKKKGSGRYRIPEAHKLQLIADFLVAEGQFDWETLKKQETLDTRLPLHIANFLRSGDTPELFDAPPSLLGTYEAESRTEDEVIAVKLSINEGTGSYFSVQETLFTFDTGVENPFEKLRTSGRNKPEPRNVTRSTGWGIVTPEENILFFQKDIESMENHFWKLGIEEFFWVPKPVESLFLHRFDWPYSISTMKASADEVQRQYFEHCAPRFLHFRRTQAEL